MKKSPIVGDWMMNAVRELFLQYPCRSDDELFYLTKWSERSDKCITHESLLHITESEERSTKRECDCPVTDIRIDERE